MTVCGEREVACRLCLRLKSKPETSQLRKRRYIICFEQLKLLKLNPQLFDHSFVAWWCCLGQREEIFLKIYRYGVTRVQQSRRGQWPCFIFLMCPMIHVHSSGCAHSGVKRPAAYLWLAMLWSVVSDSPAFLWPPVIQNMTPSVWPVH